jgi:hypothetical protein
VCFVYVASGAAASVVDHTRTVESALQQVTRINEQHGISVLPGCRSAQSMSSTAMSRHEPCGDANVLGWMQDDVCDFLGVALEGGDLLLRLRIEEHSLLVHAARQHKVVVRRV